MSDPTDVQAALQDAVAATVYVIFASCAAGHIRQLLASASVLAQATQLLTNAPTTILHLVCTAHLAAVAAITADQGTSHTGPQRSVIAARLRDAGELLARWLPHCQQDAAPVDLEWLLVARLFVKLLCLHAVKAESSGAEEQMVALLTLLQAAAGTGLTVDGAACVAQMRVAMAGAAGDCLPADVQKRLVDAMEEDAAETLKALGVQTSCLRKGSVCVRGQPLRRLRRHTPAFSCVALRHDHLVRCRPRRGRRYLLKATASTSATLCALRTAWPFAARAQETLRCSAASSSPSRTPSWCALASTLIHHAQIAVARCSASCRWQARRLP